MKYIPTIGLEVHVELKTRTKMFCDSLNDPDEKHPNINICPICLSHPGTLPVINEEAVKKVIKVGLALNCSLERETFFERKNYFYPDLPKGYQISQYQKPFCRDGWLEIPTSADRQSLAAHGKESEGHSPLAIGSKRIRIERIHLEEDTGRLYHLSGKDYTLVDFNRAGIPLMELVTRPDLQTADDVRAFVQELQLILRYLKASDADMEKGQMRVEVNISLRKDDGQSTIDDRRTLGTKVEVKNINSISAAAKAVEYEIARQTEALESGKNIVQETRGWDDVHMKTVSQRTKEGSADYRYFPEPDLPPIKIQESRIKNLESSGDIYLDEIRAELPELPDQRRKRFAEQYGLPAHDVAVFTVNKLLGDYFEKVASELVAFDKLGHLERPLGEHTGKLIKLASNYCITELGRMADEVGAEPNDTKITPDMFADLVVRIFHGQVSSSGGQAVLKEMFATGLNPDHIIHEKDLAQVSDTDELNQVVERVISENKQAVDDFKKGKEVSLKFLVGKAMAVSRGRANPLVVTQLFKEKLQ